MTLTIRHFVLSVISTVALLLLVPTFASAQAIDLTVEQELFGWAWSDTIGWISMNCDQGPGNNTCSDTEYRVSRAPSGNLQGFAWSEHIGWIQFGGLSESQMPSTSESPQQNAAINSGGVMSGWVKALAGEDFDDGWDGWVSLRGSSYGITFQLTGDNAGETFGSDIYAWGSVVVGWVDFSGVTLGGQPVGPGPSGTISGPSFCPIPIGQSTCTADITWQINNSSDPRATGPGLNSNNPAGTQQVTLDRGGPYTFQALDGSNILDTLFVTVDCPPTATWNGSICTSPLPDLTVPPLSFNVNQVGNGTVSTGIRDNNLRFDIRNIGATSTDAVFGGTSVNQQPGRVYHSIEITDVTNDPALNPFGPRVSGEDRGTITDDNFLSGAQGTINPSSSRQVNYNGIDLLFGRYRVTVTADPNSFIEDADRSNNSYSQVVTIPPPQFTPNLTVTPRIIRYGEDALLEWSGIPPWVTCVVSGAGLPGGSLTVLGSSGDSGSFTLTNRTSSSRYQMVCTEPSTGAIFTSPEARLEVLPRLEEI